MKQPIDLTPLQKDYAVYLPAISSFYSTYVAKQRLEEFVPNDRIPKGFDRGIEGMNFLNPEQGYFTYKYALYSAGHAQLDLNKSMTQESMIQQRDRANTMILGDSGGYQIGKGVLKFDWLDFEGKSANETRQKILEWLELTADWSMMLDVPTWACDHIHSPKTGLKTFEDCLEKTRFNNDYFLQNRLGQTKWLNVLQGSDWDTAEKWYRGVVEFSDSKGKYAGKEAEGWAMGGANMCKMPITLKRLITLRDEGLLEGKDWMHFLGTSKLEWAVLLTVIQRAVRKYANPAFTISFDCASPFLATANGQVYYQIDTTHNEKWSYRMSPIVDDKKYSSDTRPYGQAAVAEGWVPCFDESPISQTLTLKDICHYAPGDLNKNGKEGKTSWDSFSYALLMGHNVWTHIEAVQRANRDFDAGTWPYMMWYENGDHAKFADIVEAIFAAPTREESEAIIEHYDRYWMDIVGTRGHKGKKAKNAMTMFNNLFEVEDDDGVDGDEVEFDETKLDALEND